MKTKLLLLVVVLMSYVANAQAIQTGESQVNLGVGLSGWGIPVYANYEYGFTDVISGGVEGSYRSFNEKYFSNNYKYSVFGIAAFANYHANDLLNVSSPWDIYAGATLGYYSVSVDNYYQGAFASGLSFGGQIGARYYFSDKMGVNLEFNGGSVVTGGKLGLTIKL